MAGAAFLSVVLAFPLMMLFYVICCQPNAIDRRSSESELKVSAKQRVSLSNATVEDDPPGTYSFARRIGFYFQTLSLLVKGI